MEWYLTEPMEEGYIPKQKTFKELLVIAKSKYPIGTKFYSAYNGKEEIAETVPYDYGGGIAVRYSSGVVYHKHKQEWAKLVSESVLNYSLF